MQSNQHVIILSAKHRCHPAPCGLFMWLSSFQVGCKSNLQSHWEMGPLEPASERGDQLGLAAFMHAKSCIWSYNWQVQVCIMEVMKGGFAPWYSASQSTRHITIASLHRHPKTEHTLISSRKKTWLIALTHIYGLTHVLPKICPLLLIAILPDSYEVMWSMNLKQAEVEFDAKTGSYGDQPRAVSWAGVLVRITWGEDGPIVWRDVSTTRHWGREEEGRQRVYK